MNALPAPAAKYIAGSQYTYADVGNLGADLRWDIKVALEKGLYDKFQELGGECRVYFNSFDPNMTVSAFVRGVQVAWFPDWHVGHIAADHGCRRSDWKGWTLIDMFAEPRGGRKGALVRANDWFKEPLTYIADLIYDVSDFLCHKYDAWIQAEFGLHDGVEELTTDQLFIAMQYLLQCVPEIGPKLQQLKAEQAINRSM